MAKSCSICGARISPVSSYTYFKTPTKQEGPVCDGCWNLLKRIQRSASISPESVSRYSETVESLRALAANSGGDSAIRQEMIAIADRNLETLRSELEHQESIKALFETGSSHCVGEFLLVNNDKELFAITLESGLVCEPHAFSDLIDFEVKENDLSVTSGRAGEAAVGALLAGTAGAIVGSSMSKRTTKLIDSLDIVLSLRNFDEPTATIKLISERVERDSIQFAKTAERCNQITAALKHIMDNSSKTSTNKERGARAIYAFSVADEILKFKQLLDSGIITTEEFDIQKQKLLSLDY